MFNQVYDKWLTKQIAEETNPRRRERLKKGLTHSSVLFLQSIWYPTIGHFDNLYPEYEVRDFNNGYRYLDFAYMPGDVKGCIEIQDYRSHARDIETGRFKDLCMRQALLGLDDWLILPVAYLSIRDDPGVCKQLTLSFIGKFLSMDVPGGLNWLEAESLRFARRIIRPFTPKELAVHLRISEQYARTILRKLVAEGLSVVASGKVRRRTYRLP